MQHVDPHDAVQPLRYIFWGGLLWILDLSCNSVSNGTGFNFDLLNDLLGALMIAWGVGQLCEMPIRERYLRSMRYVRLIARIAILVSLLDFFIFPEPWPLGVALNLFSLASLVAVALFCRSMRWMCQAFGLAGAADMWRITFYACLVIYCLPLGVLDVIGTVALLGGRPLNIDLGPEILVLLPLFLLPLILLFVSTSRMAREAEHLPPELVPELPATPSRSSSWERYALLAVVLVVGGGLLAWLLVAPPRMLVNPNPAVCMCSMGFGMLPEDPVKRAEFESYIVSQEFILTILERDPKYAELIPEAGNFWHPTYVNGRFSNNNVPTNFDSSYQTLFMDLRKDIYTEVDYQMALVQLASDNPEELRRAFSALDAAKRQNPLLDIVQPLAEAAENAQSEEARAYLAAALEAAQQGQSTERAYYNERDRRRANEAPSPPGE